MFETQTYVAGGTPNVFNEYMRMFAFWASTAAALLTGIVSHYSHVCFLGFHGSRIAHMHMFAFWASTAAALLTCMFSGFHGYPHTVHAQIKSDNCAGGGALSVVNLATRRVGPHAVCSRHTYVVQVLSLCGS